MHRLLDVELLAADVRPDRRIVISGDEGHHAARVKRLAVGEAVEILNGTGMVARGSVERLNKSRGEVIVRIEESRTAPPPAPRIRIVSAVPKGARAEAMVDQLSQLGVAEYQPLRCERGVVEPRAAKIDKWKRIAAESAKQCGRAHLMKISDVRDLREAIDSDPSNGRRLLADTGGEPAWRALRAAGRGAGDAPITVFVGPEGGFTDPELNLLRGHETRSIALGPFVLRIETASVAAAAVAAGLITAADE